jgi:hypothetical protein
MGKWGVDEAHLVALALGKAGDEVRHMAQGVHLYLHPFRDVHRRRRSSPGCLHSLALLPLAVTPPPNPNTTLSTATSSLLYIHPKIRRFSGPTSPP